MTDLRKNLELLSQLQQQHPDDDEQFLLSLREQLGKEHPLYQTLLQLADVGATRKGFSLDVLDHDIKAFGPHGSGGGLNEKRGSGSDDS